MDEGTARDDRPAGGDLRGALRVYLEAEAAFGMTEIPAGEAPSAGLAPEPGPEPGTGDAGRTLAEIAERIAACTRCRLAGTRTRTVPGQGHPRPRIAFVGEGPGADEDREGLAFVGRAGQLLTKMIAAMGFSRDDVFILNVVKCRPPENRPPLPDEIGNCREFLDAQIRALDPGILCALGGVAARALLGTESPVGKLRGRIHDAGGRRLVVTWHPAYLLRNPAAKADAWADLKLVLATLGLPVPAAGR